MNRIRDINDIVKSFELNLKIAFDAINHLIKMKYGKEYSIKITNLFYPQKIPSLFDINDRDIILCLQLLKTFLDIYIFKQKKFIKLPDNSTYNKTQ